MSAKGEGEAVELSSARQGWARRVAEARATIPDFHLTAALGGFEKAPPVADCVAAAARALREHPSANATYRDGRVELHSRVNVGFTVFAAHGPVQPTVFDADDKDAEQIAGEVEELRAAAHDGTLRAPQASGSTFSVTVLDSPASLGARPLLLPPHSAALWAAPGSLTICADARAVLPPDAADLLESVRNTLSLS